VFFTFFPVNLAIDACVNLNDAAVPVVTSVLWLIASHFVSDSESFERVGARDACE
jgi:3-deoxy-D-arabino-heptulosonate 7-phosphate (DAHP) synthase